MSDKLTYMMEKYPNFTREIRERFGAGLGAIIIREGEEERLFCSIFEMGYVTGQADAAKGKLMPDLALNVETVTQNDTSAKSEDA